MTSSWTAPPLLARPACSAAERHPSDSRHGQWIFALGPRLARATAVAHGHQRSPAVIDVRRNRRSPALELTQLGRHERANQLVVPRVGVGTRGAADRQQAVFVTTGEPARNRGGT